MIGAAKRFIGQNLKQAGHAIPSRYPEGTIFLKDDQAQIYFGYYDITPFDRENKSVLAMRTAIGNESPHDRETPIELGYFDLSESGHAFRSFGKSHCWNWQQGCRLQWLDDDQVIYNDYRDRKFISCVYDFGQEKIVRVYDAPVYAVSMDNRYALTLDFSRLHRFRPGYGYSNTPHQYKDQDSAVDYIDMETGAIHTLISYEAIRKIPPLSEVKGELYINHLSCSPDGKRFIFFFITFEDGKRTTYLMTAQTDGSGLSLLAQDIQPSHYAWKNSNEILITGKKNNSISYNLVNCESGMLTRVRGKSLNVDGHPSFIDSEIFISDTYPDRLGHQYLFRQNLQGGDFKSIAHFHLPPSFSGEKRCDLHPRLSSDGKLICVDIVQDNRRCMALIPVKD